MLRNILLRSLALILISHVVIFLILYTYPSLTTTIESHPLFPAALNGTLSAAMSAAVLTIKRPTAFLTRQIILSNPQYRAGKPCRLDIARAYNIFSELSASIRRSPTPYKTSRSYSSSSTQGATSSKLPPLSLHISASSSGKRDEFHPAQATFDYVPSQGNALGLQRGSTIHDKRKAPRATAFAIADGVGGWTERGIDPADFSHGLCSHMAAIASQWNASTPPLPKQLLQQGYDALKQDPEIEAGGSTACVGVVEPNGRMRVANLGDSGYIQLRLGRVHHSSEPQTHAFNTPYQMSLTPPDILRQATVFGGVPLNDEPDRADTADHMLAHGDVLVLATDGVWDNLDAQDVLQIVSRIMRSAGAWQLDREHGFGIGEKLSGLVQREGASKYGGMDGTLQATIAASIVGEAKTAGRSRKRDGPFAKAFRRELPGESYVGGKPDDIAVLVGVAVENRVKAKL
ncbi:uncharacterized protein AB675_2602 [Cyphellophora attinorum]|uniref:Protein phosphatase n=1 Tax=Cyphellophora attinorum TaxID=1664694 RepID=A0A0N1P2A0_9EURO|nr:uncharacterized protein AB675_2602 [Phialophora attinorum]KPI44915.1 hypothetical protein AB675_2602 [Phialophora attinorum]